MIRTLQVLAATLAVAQVSIATAAVFELVPPNPTPTDVLAIFVREQPPACPNELRSNRPNPRNVIVMVIVNDIQTVPGAISCEWEVAIGALPAGRYTIQLFNQVLGKTEFATFDVQANGAGGLLNQPVPGLGLWALCALSLICIATGVLHGRRSRSAL